MFSRTAQQAMAASLATIATVAILVGLHSLALMPHGDADAMVARAATPATTQIVVVTGKRLQGV